MANIIKTISEAIFAAVSPVGISTPDAGQAVVGVDSVYNRLFSIDENGVTTYYGAKGEYNDFQGPRLLTYFTDFLCESLNPPFVGTATGSGAPTSVFYSGRRGVVKISSSTNPSGYRYMTGMKALSLVGGEEFTIVFMMDNVSNTTCYVGFHDTTGVTAPTNGAYFEIVGGIAKAVCKAAGGQTSSSTYALTAGTWYKIRIIVSTGGVAFALTDESEATKYLTESMDTNVPTAELGAGFLAYDAITGGKPNGYFWVDYIRLDL